MSDLDQARVGRIDAALQESNGHGGNGWSRRFVEQLRRHGLGLAHVPRRTLKASEVYSPHPLMCEDEDGYVYPSIIVPLAEALADPFDRREIERALGHHILTAPK